MTQITEQIGSVSNFGGGSQPANTKPKPAEGLSNHRPMHRPGQGWYSDGEPVRRPSATIPVDTARLDNLARLAVMRGSSRLGEGLRAEVMAAAPGSLSPPYRNALLGVSNALEEPETYDVAKASVMLAEVQAGTRTKVVPDSKLRRLIRKVASVGTKVVGGFGLVGIPVALAIAGATPTVIALGLVGWFAATLVGGATLIATRRNVSPPPR